MAWLVCFSAGLFFFYEFFQLNLFDVINQSLRDDFQLDASALSWLSSAYLWANILFLLPAGVLLDRFSVRRVMLIAMMLCVVGTVGFGLTHAFVWAFFFHFLSGIGNAFCFLSCVVLASRWFPPHRQALVIGSLVTMAFLGGMMAHSPLAYLNAHFGWRQALMIDGGVGALVFLWLCLIVKDRPAMNRMQSEAAIEPLTTAFIHALQNRQNYLCGLYTSCLNLPIMVLGALWGGSYLSAGYHLSVIQASHVVSFLFIGSMLGCPLMGWLSDALGLRKLPMCMGAILSLLVFIPLFLGLALSKDSLCLIFFAIGFFTSAQVIAYPFITESNRLAHTGAAIGLASVIIMGGGGVGQIVFGKLVKYHADSASQHYSAIDFQYALWMFPAAILVALLALMLTRESRANVSIKE